MDPTPSRPWPLWVLGALGVGLLVWAIVARSRRPARLRAAMAADAEDPFRRWAQGAFGLVCGEWDYAYLGVGEAVALLARWWEVHGPVELIRTLDDLEGEPDHAWPLVRALVVARLGVGARWLSPDEAWGRARGIARRLRETYDDWPALAHAYVVARRLATGLAADGSEDDDDMRAILDNVARLRETCWAQTPFRAKWREA